MADDRLFREKAPGIMRQLMNDFDLDDFQAAGILGNLGHESGGFKYYHELGQPENKGGYGWAQWTASRRVAFFAWSDEHQLQRESDEASYGFLKYELETTEKRTIPALVKTRNLKEAVISFERNYERAGITNYESRIRWGQIAMKVFQEDASGGSSGGITDDITDTTVFRQYKVMARNGLALYQEAGTQYDKVGSLSAGQTIHVMSIKDGWAKVDVEGDGFIDGFASASYLQPV